MSDSIKIQHCRSEEVVYEAQATSLRGTVEMARAEGVDLAGAYLADAYLAGANLSDAKLAGARLAGANLVGANLARAYLVDANLDGANLADASVVDAGQDVRSYRFIAVRNHRCGYMVHAGCRWLTREDAQEHWAQRHKGRSELHAEIQAKLALIEAVAVARGWVEEEDER